MKLKNNLLLLAGLLVIFTFTINSFAAPGDLDTSFGTGGKVLTTIGSSESPKDVVVQPDGKIVVYGETSRPTFGFDVVLIRYNADGSLDTSFGTNGIAAPNETGNQRASAFVLQPDGKFIAAAMDFTTVNQISLYRFNANGTLDTSFGSGGKFAHTIGLRSEAYDVALQTDGKIVIAGSIYLTDRFLGAVYRFNANGTLDTSFNSVGYNTNPVNVETAGSVAIQPDGKIVVGESTSVGALRYNSDGTLEGSRFFVCSNNPIRDLVLQNDSKIVSLCNNFEVIRFNQDKTRDNSFGNSGANSASSGTATAMVIQPNGQVIVGGYVNNSSNQTGWDFTLARLKTNGFPDVGFGSGGRVSTQVSGDRDFLRKLALQPDGKIIAVGDFNDSGFAVVRFLGGVTNALPNRTAFDFDGDGRAEISVYRPSTGFWYSIYSLNNTFNFTAWGLSTDILMPADYNADSRTDYAAYRSNQVNISLDGFLSGYLFNITQATQLLTGDITGDGRADVADFNNGLWRYCTNGGGGGGCFAPSQFSFGQAGDKPVLADFDGDRKADFTVYRPSNGTWTISLTANNGIATVPFGIASDLVVPADYDGDGKADIAVFRPSVGDWYWLNSSNGSFTGVHWGANGDKPVPADYDGDGKTDLGVFRPSDGTWYLYQSTEGFKAVNWGLSTDIPIPNVYVR